MGKHGSVEGRQQEGTMSNMVQDPVYLRTNLVKAPGEGCPRRCGLRSSHGRHCSCCYAFNQAHDCSLAVHDFTS
eukprot:1153452-Pelagomonas_calceolata.AAC.5